MQYLLINNKQHVTILESWRREKTNLILYFCVDLSKKAEITSSGEIESVYQRCEPFPRYFSIFLRFLSVFDVIGHWLPFYFN